MHARTGWYVRVCAHFFFSFLERLVQLLCLWISSFFCLCLSPCCWMIWWFFFLVCRDVMYAPHGTHRVLICFPWLQKMLLWWARSWYTGWLNKLLLFYCWSFPSTAANSQFSAGFLFLSLPSKAPFCHWLISWCMWRFLILGEPNLNMCNSIYLASMSGEVRL